MLSTIYLKSQKLLQPGLAEINARVGPQEVMPLLKDSLPENNSSVQVGPTNFKHLDAGWANDVVQVGP